MEDTGNTAKLKELILYVAAHTEADPKVGALKFNKLLFYADFMAYGMLGKSITGVQYQRLPRGPAPRPIMPLVKAMVVDGEAARAKRFHMGYQYDRIIALRDADISQFSGQELDIVVQVIKAFWGVTGAELSEKSHKFLGWKLAKEGETIPYNSVFLSARELTTEEQEFARELVSSSSAA